MLNMKKIIAALSAILVLATAAFAAPNTTKPSLLDMLLMYGCDATHLIIGGSSTPACGPGFGSTNTASTIVQRDGSGNFSAGTMTGTATIATNTTITDDTTTNATVYPTWVTANTGSLPQKTASTKLSFNPSTGALSSTVFSGAGTGLTGTAASLTAGNVTTNANLTGDVTSIGNATTYNNLVPLAKGGMNANNTASAGGIPWSDASKINILAGTTTARLPLLSGNAATPVWGVYTLPASVTSGGIPYFSSTSAESSSALLAANGPMIGGGAGAAPATVTAGTNGQLFLGVTSGAPQFASMSQDATITNAGVITVTKTNNVSFAASATTDTTVATNISSGTLPAGRMPALTGDCTTSAGAVATTCTKINGVDQTTAWTTFTPTVTCDGGAHGPPTLSTNVAAYKFSGKSYLVRYNVVISALNGCTASLSITLPNSTTAQGSTSLGATDFTSFNATGAALTASSTTITLSQGGAILASHDYRFGGPYEAQ